MRTIPIAVAALALLSGAAVPLEMGDVIEIKP